MNSKELKKFLKSLSKNSHGAATLTIFADGQESRRRRA